jgi:serine/threonine-protein kinase
MLLVFVPAGSFLMGSADSDGMAYADEKPQHSVSLDAFWIDRTEVTNGKYALCVQAKACRTPLRFSSNVHDHYYGNSEYADFPVIYVSWNDAHAYCQWAGRRLPTEAEWEKAARGTDVRIYPWGNDPPDKTLLNFNNIIQDIAKTGNYPGGASPYGALDMAGNVWEWVADWYGLNAYAQGPASNPTGPGSGTQRVLRGGSWHYDAAGVRSAYRFQKEPAFSSYEIGIRCASSSAP